MIMTRIVSVWLPRWPIARFIKEEARNPSPADPVDPERPFILARDASGGPVIAAANPAAENAGLRIGERVANARARAEGLQVRPVNPQADETALRRLALWAMRYTPAVSAWETENGADGFFLDVTGAAHLFGGEAMLLGDIAHRLELLGLTPRLAVADTAGAAWALCHFHSSPSVVLPSSQEAEGLRPLPIEALRLQPDTCATLRRLGFKRIGAVLEKARAPFAARFEKELLERLDQAQGHAPEPLRFLAPPPDYSSLRQLLEPIVTQEAVIKVAKRLMSDIIPQLRRDGMGARRLSLGLFRVDGEVFTVEIGTAMPTREPAHVAHLVGLKLERMEIMAEAGFGFESLRLAVTASERVEPHQKDLTSLLGDADNGEREALLLDGIGERIGSSRIRHFEPVASHLPERAEALRTGMRKPCAWPVGAGPRPLLLLCEAEEADVLALLPEGPPKRFRWRGVIHGVAHSQGPERIADEWWRSSIPKPQRDYYFVEDEKGRRFWLYREGFSEEPPRWFVHGLFG
jgi:protein ImuB